MHFLNIIALNLPDKLGPGLKGATGLWHSHGKPSILDLFELVHLQVLQQPQVSIAGSGEPKAQPSYASSLPRICEDLLEAPEAQLSLRRQI